MVLYPCEEKAANNIIAFNPF